LPDWVVQVVNLPLLQDRVVTSTAPQSSVSRSDITSSNDQMARALSQVADATMDIATRQAKDQAAEDLAQQKVVRNPDGSVSTINPANSVIFGRAGEAYSEAVKAGTIAQHSNVISQEMTDLHTKYATDPGGFKAASTAWLDKYREQHGGGIAGQAIQQQAERAQTQHLDSIVTATANLDITNQQKSIQATISDQKNTLQGLARQPGGVEAPEFKEALERLQSSYQALGSNPLFRMPKEQIDLELKSFKGLLQGEALVAHVDETFTRKGKAEASQVLNREILQNPNLSEADRSRLYTHGMARLQYLTGDAKEKIDAGRKVVGELETNIANGTIKPTDPIIGMEIRQALERGDPEAANRITAAAQVRTQFSGISTLPQALQAEVLGIKRPGAVNTAIPIEGRALLDHIAGTESAGRYDVRYGGNGDKTFQGYADHPRIYEPITSGPDVGKTSSAAGRYQFIGSTWDQQAKKLGLKDFSPENQDTAAWDLAQTEYKAKTGKDLLTVLKSGDQAAISDVPRQLSGQWSSLPGGRQPAGGGRALAPAANGGPGFTAEDLQRNPFLGSAYVRTLAADESLRIQSATQAAAGVGKAIDQGLLARPDDVALVNQTAAQYPEKFGKIAEDMNGRILGGALAALEKPQRDSVLAEYRDATNGQDQHHMNVAAAALDQYQKAEKNLADHPYQEAATRGWISPVAPIDPGNPDSVAGALAERVAAGQRIAAMNHTPAPPVLGKDELPQLQSALEGPQGAAVLATIATVLKPEEVNTLLGEKGFTNALTSMMSSKDPAKMSTAMGVVDKLWRDNPAQAEGSLGGPAVTKLQAWQALRGSFNAEELAARLNAADDPATLRAREAAKDGAEKEVKGLSASDMAYKLGTGWPGIGRLTGSTPSAPFDSIKGGELVADYQATYTALRTYGVDADKASDLAVQRLQSSWGVSGAAGNQVMKMPPEKYYPQVDGSHDWIQKDLTGWVEKRAGAQFSAGPRTLEAGFAGVAQDRNWEIAGMITDGQTQAAITQGRPPSYQVAIKRKDGTLDILPGRVGFDPADHIDKYGAKLRARQEAVEQGRALDTGMPQP
jgi:muramidase (phage lysozyme)